MATPGSNFIPNIKFLRKKTVNCTPETKTKNPKNAYKIGNNQNFQKQKIAFLTILMTTLHTKNEASATKTVACRAVTDTQTHRHTDTQTHRQS